MARKLNDVFDDKILESKKPAGCIGGIFQLFDCQHLLGGRQHSEQSNRRDASARGPVSPSISLSCNLEKNQNRRPQDKPRYSMESSRTSYSSTFTSFSSLEHKSQQEESIYTHHSFLSGTSPRNSPRTSTDINKSPAFKEIIKESIYRDLCSAATKEDDNKRNEVLESIHSPRTMELSKDSDLDESLRLVLKFKVSPERFYAGHSPRFSYDGTEMSQALIDMKEYGNKHSGLSRLSLDSREGSLRGNLSPKINSAVKEIDTKANKRVPATLSQLQDLESNEKNSSVVAKLMGFEPLNSATQNSIRCYDPLNKQNQIAAYEKALQSPRNIAKSPRRNSPHLDLPSKVSIEEASQIVMEHVEENMNKKIESVFNKAKKRLEKLPCHHSSKKIQDIKRVISETKKNGNRKLRSVNSLSIQFTPPSYRTNEVSIRALKCPIVIMEPARKLDVSFSKVIKLEGDPVLGNIRTGDSRTNRKDFFKKQTKVDQSSPEKKGKFRGPHPLSKEPSERPVNNAVSPRLQQMKPGLKIKASAIIPSHDLNKSPRQPVNSQLLDSVSPRCKLRNKLNKVQDIEIHNSGEQVNVEAVKVNSCIEGKGKSLLLRESVQSSSVKVGTGAALVSKSKVILKDNSAKEFNLVSPQRSCPNSLPDALLNQDSLLHSPVPVSTVFKEYKNIPSDRNLNMECHRPTIPFTMSNVHSDSDISESKNTTQSSRDLGTTINEAPITNAMCTLENQDKDRPMVAEKFLFRGLLQKESNLISILEQINSDKQSEFVQKTNPQKLHQKLFFDVMNEILVQKMDVSSSSGRLEQILHSKSFNMKHLYKYLCSEIKCIQSCKEGNVDDNSMIHKDLIWNSQRWDCIESEIPMLVLEIERLIFKDLMNDVVNGLTAVALDAKRRRKRDMFAKDKM